MNRTKLAAVAMFGVGMCSGLLLGLALYLPAEGEVSVHNVYRRQVRQLQSTDKLTVQLNSKNVPIRLSSDNKHENKTKPLGLWPQWIEDKLPPGFNFEASRKWREELKHHYVIETKSGCGRGQNQLLTLDNGQKACARYRKNLEQIQGEVYSSLLGQLMRLPNLLPLAIQTVNMKTPFWRHVSQPLTSAGWVDNTVCLLTPWLEDLRPVMYPPELKPESRQSINVDLIPQKTSDMSRDALTELVQWTDLVIFDYLTGNVDRAINNLFNRQWNPSALDSATHNLEKNSEGLLIFLDNESGLLHSYRLLDKYSSLHEQLLSRVCVFRSTTVNRIRQLAASRVDQQIWDMHQRQLAHKYVPRLPQKHAKTLIQRLSSLKKHIDQCLTR